MLNYVIVTCEHGGNRIPASYRCLFKDHEAILQSHRGYDAGALRMAKDLASAFSAPLIASTISRLLVDLNRSVGNPSLHGEMVRVLPAAVRTRIVDRYYVPHHASVATCVQNAVHAGHRVIHIASHSFTPALFGKVRNADVGLLYDPARRVEVALASLWKMALEERSTALVVRRNFPYQGRGDGLTRTLRRRYAPNRYVGIELELNQKYSALPEADWRNRRRSIVLGLRDALSTLSS